MNELKSDFQTDVLELLNWNISDPSYQNLWSRPLIESDVKDFRIALVFGDEDFAIASFDKEMNLWNLKEVNSEETLLHSEVMESLEHRNYVSLALSFEDVLFQRHLNGRLVSYADIGFHVRVETWRFWPENATQPWSVVYYDSETKQYEINANKKSALDLVVD